jgi:hypothetical protein
LGDPVPVASELDEKNALALAIVSVGEFLMMVQSYTLLDYGSKV